MSEDRMKPRKPRTQSLSGVSLMAAPTLSLPPVSAWLIANGHRVELFRSRTFAPKRFRGMFWIHANRAEFRSDYDRVIHEMPEIAKLIPAWVDFPWYGAIIGRAAIIDMIPSPERGLIRFVVDCAQALPEPVFWAHTLGYSRFYDAPDYVLEELRSHHGAFT